MAPCPVSISMSGSVEGVSTTTNDDTTTTTRREAVRAFSGAPSLRCVCGKVPVDFRFVSSSHVPPPPY
jgi:hypothetical protein